MRAVNLLPSDLRGAAPASRAAARVRSASASRASAPTWCWAPSPSASPLLAVYVLATNNVKQRRPTSTARHGAGRARRRRPPQAQAVRRLRGAGEARASRRCAASPPPASTGSRRCATSPAPSRPTSSSQSLNGDMGLPGHRRRRRRPAPRLDPGAGDQPRRLRVEPAQRRADDGPPARRRRRDPRLALQVREGATARRRDAASRRAAGREPADLLDRRLLRALGRARRVRARRPPTRPPRPPVPVARRAVEGDTPAAHAGTGAPAAGQLRAGPGAPAPTADLDLRSRCPVTRSPKILIPALARGRRGRRVLVPRRSRPSARRPRKLDERHRGQAGRSSTSRAAQAATYEKAQGQLQRRTTRRSTRLGKAVPADDDVRSLLVQLDDAAKRSKVDFHSINVGAGGGAAGHDGGAAAATGLAPAARHRAGRQRRLLGDAVHASASRAASSACRTSSTGSSTS